MTPPEAQDDGRHEALSGELDALVTLGADETLAAMWAILSGAGGAS